LSVRCRPRSERKSLPLGGDAENAGVEKAGVEKSGVDSRGGICRSGKCRSDNGSKAVRKGKKRKVGPI